MGVGIQVEHLNAWFGKTQALYDISMNVAANHATAIIGPSGCGKSTFVRCLNRMHETIPEAHATGRVRIGELDVYNGSSAVQIRRRIGMVFQKPNPFPTMSIYDNVAAGLKLNGFRNRRKLDEIVQRSLTHSALWDEVKDIMHKKSGASLSGGQQQRLCIARALAVEPQVILMDEPCSALDPISTGKIEELIFQLKEHFTIVIVAHNMQQPMAVDLRFILAVTKINADLERVGDQAVNIAERVMDMVELPKADLPVDIPRMATAASAMVRRALESFIEGKAELAQAVLEMDNVVDRMRDDAFIRLVKTMNDRPEVTRQALDALLIARNLERVADHATNIAEDVIFWVRGADVRHNVAQEAAAAQPTIPDTH